MRIQAIRKMPLSIDEEESRCTVGRGKEGKGDEAEGKRFRERTGLFIENLQNRRARKSGKRITKMK
jgi:hypothetical protein